MDYTIEYFSNVKKTQGNRVTYSSFKAMAEMFRDCRRLDDKLDNGGWVRGKLKDSIRNSKNITHTSVIILDGDKKNRDSYSCCPAHVVHQTLKELGVNHFLYTSFSNNPTLAVPIYRWRLVVPTTRELDSDEVKQNSVEFCKLLNDAGCDVAYANENKAMAQMWFMPASPDPEKRFEFYEFHEGEEYEPTTVGPYSDQLGGASKSGPLPGMKPDVCAMSNGELIKAITGGDNLHESLRNLSYQMMQDTNSPYWTQTMLDALLSTLDQDERVRQRRADLPRLVEGVGAQLRGVTVDFEFLAENRMSIDPPRAPGVMGQFIQEAIESQVYPNACVATVTVLGLIAGICGRVYQAPAAMQTGCNEYFLLSMSTGGGKQFCTSFISRTIRQSAGLKSLNWQQFVGSQSFTGGKALRNMLVEKRSCVCVLTEMGKMLQSQAGDQASLRKTILGAYTQSGPYDYLGTEEYSKADENNVQIESPALTIIGEAEPSGFIAALNDTNALRDGFLPRSVVFRADGKRPYANRDPRKEISQELREIVSRLMENCNESKDKLMIPVEVEPGIEADIDRYGDYWTDELNRYTGVDTQKAVMASRSQIHALKMATLSSIVNSKMGSIPVMTAADWDWGKAMAQYSYDGITSFMGGTGTAEGLEDVLAFVYRRLADLFLGKNRSKQFHLNRFCVKKGNTLPEKVLRELVGKSPEVRSLAHGGREPKTGYEVLLEYFRRNDCVVEYNMDQLYLQFTSNMQRFAGVGQ